jgi:hypothetical protein
MKTEAVNLRGPTIINDLTRYPTENPVTVSEAEARSLRDRGLLVDDEDADDADVLDSMKVAELKALAHDHSIDLGGATTKAQIIAVMRAAKAEHDARVDGLDDMGVDELKALAGEEDIDLGNATTQADIVAAIRAARADDDKEA